MFKDTNLQDKLEVFFDLADVDGSGEIEEQELYDVLKINVNSYEERASLKHAIKELFRSLDIDGSGSLSREELIKICDTDSAIKTIIEKSIDKAKGIDNWIENDLNKPFQTRITFGAGSAKCDTVWFPFLERLTQAIGDKEAVMDKVAKLKAENTAVLRRLKGKDEFESSDSEEEADF